MACTELSVALGHVNVRGGSRDRACSQAEMLLQMFTFPVNNISNMHLILVGSAAMWHHREVSYCTFPLHFHFLLLLPSDSSLQQWGSGSAGLNVLRDALLKAQGPISLVQMHRVSLKFHANRHILFKQLRGYPQEEARPPLSVLLVSFFWNHQSRDVQDGAEWLGQQSSIRNILAAIFTPLRMCLRSFYVTEKAQLTTFRANAHISLLLTCHTSMIYAYLDIHVQRTCYMNMIYEVGWHVSFCMKFICCVICWNVLIADWLILSLSLSLSLSFLFSTDIYSAK